MRLLFKADAKGQWPDDLTLWADMTVDIDRGFSGVFPRCFAEKTAGHRNL